MAARALPYPPLELANRVGSLEAADRPLDYYDELGRETREGITGHLPADWSFAGKRVLDFGCGAGRTLRHFTAEAADAELWGCDIDEVSIRWMQEELCPPFQVFVNDPDPPIAQPDESFDLIWAISVFSHLSSNWSAWLAELHRVLRPDGLLLATFMGRGMSEVIAGESWDEHKFGMNVIRYGQSWDLGGPMVIHSPWWIEEHWGRAFELVSLAQDGFGSKPWLDHGTVVMRKRDVRVTPERLEAIAPQDAREAGALAHNVRQLHAETLELRAGLEYATSELDATSRHRDEIARQGADLRAHHETEIAGRERQALELQRTLSAAQRDGEGAREQGLETAQRLLEVEETLAQARARVFALEGALSEAVEQRERGERIMEAMRRSISWRLTGPLRAVKRLAR